MEKLLKQLNPWWNNENYFNNFDYIERKMYLDKLKLLIEKKEIITITGIRRIGKSVIQKQLIKHLIEEKKINPKNILFFNIDILTLNEKKENIFPKIKEDYLKLNNPKGKIYIFLDEIQNLENWENQLKVEYDLYDSIKFILTGSNSKVLYSNISKLLTGRILNTHIFNLSFKEYLFFKKYNIKDLDYDKIEIYNHYKNYLKLGHFPETALEKNEEINFQRLNEYINSILLRDILELNNIRDNKTIIELSRFLLTNSSKLFSYNKFSKILSISKTTLKEYIISFENAFLFSELNMYDKSIKKQILNDKKIYVNLQDFFSISFKFSENIGRLLENLVFVELKRRGYEVYYHKKKKECNFVIKENLDITKAIQVTKSLNDKNTKKREIEGLLDAMKIYKLKEGLILTQDEEGEEIIEKKKILIKPIWKWLLGNHRDD